MILLQNSRGLQNSEEECFFFQYCEITFIQMSAQICFFFVDIQKPLL